MHPIAENALLSPWTPGLLSLAVFAGLVLLLMAALLVVTAWAGEKKALGEKQRAYESGIIPTGSARLRYPVPFYLVAVFFLIFDVEGVFIFTWAAAVRDLGWAGWLEITFFILMLLIGWAYIWRKGGLAWGPTAQKR